MPYSAKNFPKPTPETGLCFRERLVSWRAHNLDTQLPEPNELTLGRLNDIANPLWQIISLVSPSHLMAFEELVQEFSHKRREERAVSVEGELIRALLDLDGEVVDDKLTVSMITDKVNERRRDHDKVSSIHIGKVLRRLNFKLAGSHKEKRSYLYDTVLVQRLAIEYGLADTSTPSDYPSQVSQASPQIQEIVSTGTDGTDGTLFCTKERTRDVKLLDGRLLNWAWVFSTWHNLGRPMIHVGPGDNLFNLSPVSPNGLSPERLLSVVMWIEEHSKKMMPKKV